MVQWALNTRRRTIQVDSPKSARRFFEKSGFALVANRAIERRGRFFECLAYDRRIAEFPAGSGARNPRVPSNPESAGLPNLGASAAEN